MWLWLNNELIGSVQYELAATLTQRLDLMALGFLGRGMFASGLCWLFGKLRNRPSLLIAFGSGNEDSTM